RIELSLIVSAATEMAQVVVREMLRQTPQARIRTEEMLADVRAGFGRKLLELAVGGRVHLVDQDAADVAHQQVVPFAAPDHLDHIPAGAAEEALQLLDDLAVAPHRSVEPLQVAVDDEDEVVQLFACRQRERAERLRLVALAVADETPHAA